MTQIQEFDVVILGAGQAGQSTAERVRAAGLSVAIVEPELVGGECAYFACVPSKALLRPVIALSDVRRVDGAREAASGAINVAGVFGRRDRYANNWDDGFQSGLVSATGATLVRGHGRLDGPRRVAVSTAGGEPVVLAARHAVVVCSGSRTQLPDLPGIDEARPWTNREATSSSYVPQRLAVVGAGGVSVEMATLWRGLGSDVTLLARGASLLSRMEPFVGEVVTRGLRDAGVDVRLGVSIRALHRSDNSSVRLELDDGSELEADEVLFATGKVPSTGDIGLETVGLEPGAWLDVDDTCRVEAISEGWLYAAGDVNHRALLTHQGKYHGRIAGAAIGARAQGRPLDTKPWGAHATTADHHAVPQHFFTDPEVATVGLTVERAVQAGHRVHTVDIDIGDVVVGSALYADGYVGRARMVVDADRDQMLGVTLTGPGAAELLHSATIAVSCQVPIDRLWHAVPCFPTLNELWLKLLEAYRDSMA